MRAFLILLLLMPLLPGCTPYIPVKDDFGTSALAPSPSVPPEFAAFNNYNSGVNPLVDSQMCAMPYQPLEARSVSASPGNMVEMRGRCQTHVPLFGP